MFKSRPAGTTLRRPATPATVLRRAVEHAVVDPHDASERFDPEFVLAFQCGSCGRVGQSPRKDVSAAIRDHVERHHPGDASVSVRVLYPRQ